MTLTFEVYCITIIFIIQKQYFLDNDKDAENRDKALNNQNQNSTTQDPKKTTQHPSGNPVKNYVLEQLAKLMTTCIIIRIDDFTLYKVTTSSRKAMPKEFISGENANYK